MARPKKVKAPKTLWDKVREFDENFAVGINSMDDDEMKQKLVSLAGEDDQIEKAREDDTDLASKKEEVKTANETYSVPLKQNRMRRKLVLKTLGERGKM